MVAVVSAMGKTTDDLIRLANAVSTHPAAPRVRHARQRRASGSPWRCWSWRWPTSASTPPPSPAARPASSPTTTTPGPRSSRSRATACARRWPPGKVPGRGRVPGRLDRARHHHPRPRRLRHHRRRPGRRPRGRRLRDLHRRDRRVHAPTPGSCPRRAGINRISFDEMLEMAATGGRVLMLRAVEFARNHNVPLHVRSSFTWEPGTWVVEEDADMEQAVVTAVTHDTSEAKVTVSGVPDRPGVAARLFRAAGRPVDQRRHDRAEHVGPRHHRHLLHRPQDRPRRRRRDGAAPTPTSSAPRASTSDADVARVSLIGVGMKSHPGVAATMFETLANEEINIDMISTSTIRTSCIVRAGRRRAGRPQPPRGVRPRADGAQGEGSRTLWLLRHAKTVTDPPAGRLGLRPGAGAAGPARRHGARAASSPARARGSGRRCRASRARPWRWCRRRPARRDGRAGPGAAWRSRPRSASTTSSTAPTPRRCSPSCARCRRRRLGHGGRPQPDGALALAGAARRRRTRRAARSAVRHGFPTCALGVYAFEVERWADVADGHGQAGRALMVPPYEFAG